MKRRAFFSAAAAMVVAAVTPLLVKLGWKQPLYIGLGKTSWLHDSGMAPIHHYAAHDVEFTRRLQEMIAKRPLPPVRWHLLPHPAQARTRRQDLLAGLS